MMFKGVDFFPHNTRWKIIKWRYMFVGLSWVLAILATVLLYTRGLNYGVDFKGGSLIEIQAKSGALEVAKVRDKLNSLGLGEVQVQGVGTTGQEALIRIAQQADEKAQAAAGDKVKGALGDTVNIRRTEIVGPAVSSELKATGIKAVVFAICGILAYVWFRFEWQFAVAGVLALVHDVFITAGMFSLLLVRVRSRHGGGAADAGRLFDQRHRRRVRPHPRKPATLQEDAARASCSTCRSTRRCRAPC